MKERFGETRWSSSHMSVKRGMMRSGSTFAVLLLSPYTRAEGLLRRWPMMVASMLGSPPHDPLHTTSNHDCRGPPSSNHCGRCVTALHAQVRMWKALRAMHVHVLLLLLLHYYNYYDDDDNDE